MLTLNVAQTQNQLPDLSKLTVVQIKHWATTHEMRVPSGLKKADLIQYLTGVYHEKQPGAAPDRQVVTALLDTLQPRVPVPNVDWLIHLHTYGWAVTPIPGWSPTFVTQFFNWLASCSPNFTQDPDTWKTKNMPVMLHGILKQYFGHTELQWQIRDLCAPIFARIWGCQPEDLLCSFDGGCFMPTKEKGKNNSFKQWLHNDQFRDVTNFCCVQGIVNFVENGPEDGGLVLVENSHTVFANYMARHPSEGITWGPTDMSDPELSTLPLIKICAPAGHIILFDSRTFHCNVHPYGSKFRADGSPRFRMATYVSMQPRAGATVKELEKRRTLYEKGRMTGHWCYGKWFKETPEHPRNYGGEINRPPTIEIAPLNPLRRRLIGYD